MRCPRIGDSSFDFVYELTRESQSVASGKTAQVLWDWDARAKRRFTPELRARIAEIEAR